MLEGLPGATADIHCYDVVTNKWSRINPVGEAPTPRAAHVATAVGTMVVIQGGVCPSGLSAEDLHFLDLTQSKPQWHRLVVQGPGPGPRYGHVMALVGQRYLMIIGGNDGKQQLADVWALDTAAKPYEWRKLEPEGEGPPHACMQPQVHVLMVFFCFVEGWMQTVCHYQAHMDFLNEGMIVGNGQLPLVFRRRQDTSMQRFLLMPAYMWLEGHLVGGAWLRIHQALPANHLATLATISIRYEAAGVWCDTESVVTSPKTGRYSADAAGGDAAVELTRRCNHAATAFDDLIYLYGGLRGGLLLDDLLIAEDISAAEMNAAAASNVSSGCLAGRPGITDDRTVLEPAYNGGVVLGSPVARPLNGDVHADISHENAMIQANRRLSKGVGYLVEASAAEAEAIRDKLAKAQQLNGEVEHPDRDRDAEVTPSDKRMSSLIKPDSDANNITPAPGVMLHHQAAVVAAETGDALDGMIRQMSTDQLEKEGRQVSYGTPESATAERKHNSISKKVIAYLLKPRGWKPPVRQPFFLDCSEITELCDSAERIFSSEPTLLKLKAPIKIFANLHGQFGDLMRLFDEYGSPSTAGDIAYIDYLFLGDYVDWGQHSLETILLLLALKVEHPYNVHLIRGNHEAADINALFGLITECIERMGEKDGIWAWHRINRLFNWLPLAALIEKKIICMHGGIGRSINHLEQIENIQRPITMEAGSIILMDLLWSNPTENDSVKGLGPNARGPGLVTFGPNRVIEFNNNNGLQLIVRAHECVMDGFEQLAQGHLITVFSATNHCGIANAGAILVLGRNLVVVPKIIHPLPSHNSEKKELVVYIARQAKALGSAENNELVELSLKCFQIASVIARTHLPPTHPVRLDLGLSFSIFLHERSATDRALQVAKQTVEEALFEFDDLNEDSDVETTLIIDRLEKNVALWTTKSDIADVTADNIAKDAVEHNKYVSAILGSLKDAPGGKTLEEIASFVKTTLEEKEEKYVFKDLKAKLKKTIKQLKVVPRNDRYVLKCYVEGPGEGNVAVEQEKGESAKSAKKLDVALRKALAQVKRMIAHDQVLDRVANNLDVIHHAFLR